MGGNIFAIDRQTIRLATPRLVFCVLVYAMGNLFFGYDTGGFGALQVQKSFLKEFGQLGKNGKYSFTASKKSIMTSTPFVGKLAGTLWIAPLLEAVGHKKTMLVICAVEIVGVIMQMCAKEWVLFTCGRVVVYMATGAVEAAAPVYQAEISPAPLRGFFTGSIYLMLMLGNLWAVGMVKAFENTESKVGWMIPTVFQALPALILLAGLPFTPESPRWLLEKGKEEDALATLNKVRTKAAIASGATVEERDAISDDIKAKKAMKKGTWFDLFRGTNLRRTTICTVLFIYQQCTGTQFVNSYGPTFYGTVGRSNMAFTYQSINLAISVGAAVVAMYVMDRYGRRSILISGSAAQTFFQFMVAGLGSISQPSEAQTNTLVACFILFSVAIHMSTGPVAYSTGAEIGTAALREKTMAFGCAINVVAAWVVTFTSPYLLLAPYAALGAKVGYIWGAFSLSSTLYAIFFFPELKGRSLEEIDALFATRAWAWKFSKIQVTTGTEAAVHAAELDEVKAASGSETLHRESSKEEKEDLRIDQGRV